MLPMAIVTGPLMSIDASGTLAETLTYAKWKGRNYVRQRVIPMNPKSALQTGVRSMMSWISQRWNGLSAPDKATWDDMAETKEISPFNAYVGENLDRWQTNDTPTDAFPAAEANTDLLPDDVGVDGAILVTTGHAGYATMAATPDSTGAADAVAVAIFRGAAAPTPFSWGACIKIVDVTPGAEWTYTDSPLDAATYHYKIAYLSDDGVHGALNAADNTAVVT